MIKLTDEYKYWAKSFKKAFGYGVPLAQIPSSVDTDQLIITLKECIESQKDLLAERFGYRNSEEIHY